MKRLAVAFTGPSNSGKTTLIVKISNYLREKGFKVCIVKHDPKDKGVFDKEGKDSYKFTETKADVAVVSPNRTTVFKQKTSTIEEIISIFDEFDYLLVEGLKTLPLPRICVCREIVDDRYFEVSDTLAIDKNLDISKLPKESSYIDLENIEEIIKWIDENAKSYK